jgi:hypothetical protein
LGQVNASSRRRRQAAGPYDAEVNFAIDTFWDGGFHARHGDPMNGWTAEGHDARPTDDETHR